MKDITKLEAVRLFQEFRLEGLPAVIYDYDSRPDRSLITRDFSGIDTFMLRTGSRTEERNLPRRAGVPLDEVESWVNELPPHLDVVVQPYASVVYSVELAWYADGFVAELVPGIWELSTSISPVVLMERNGRTTLSGSFAKQPATYYALGSGYYTNSESIQDWQVQSLLAWIRKNRDGLNRLRTRVGVPALGIKLHSALGYGLSPQNIRSDVPIQEEGQIVDHQERFVHVVASDDVIEHGVDVLLDVSIAREDHAQLTELVGRLIAADVRAVYLKSGLLSHLAIALREAGLTVRRVNVSVLRP